MSAALFTISIPGQAEGAARPLDEAYPLFQEAIKANPGAVLVNKETGFAFGAQDKAALKALYYGASETPKQFVLRNISSGETRSVSLVEGIQGLQKRDPLVELYEQNNKDVVVGAPSQNPEFDDELMNLEMVQQVAQERQGQPSESGTTPNAASSEVSPAAETPPNTSRNVNPGAPPQPTEPARNTPPQGEPTTYDVHQIDANLGELPGLSGDNLMQGTLKFLANSNPATIAILGATVGALAYLRMGEKGIFVMILAALALERACRSSSQIIRNSRLDLISRGMKEGIPVLSDGKIDPDFLEAMRFCPVGNNRTDLRRVSPQVASKGWNTSKTIKIEPVQAEKRMEEVLQIVDGDTWVGQLGRYRLIGIDTPELNHREPSKSEQGAVLAWKGLEKYVKKGTKVEIEVITNQPSLHNRKPCYVYATDEHGKRFCVNQRLLEEGLAHCTNFQPYHPKIKEFVEAQLQAIREQKGLWSDQFNPSPKPSLFSVDIHKPPAPAMEMAY